MKLRTTFLTALFLFLAGAALAVPTAAEPTVPDEAELPAAWAPESVAAPTSDGYALAPPVAAPEPTELAIYNPCGCRPTPGCPFPIPWPSPGPTFPFPLPFPVPGPCPSPPQF